MNCVRATVEYAGPRLVVSVRQNALAPNRIWARCDVTRLRPFAEPLAESHLFELLDLTVALYALDRSVSFRAGRPSRTFEVMMPVADVSAWRTRAPLVHKWYRALTGDDVEIVPTQRPDGAGNHHRPLALALGDRADAVGLLSDGLDSLCGIDAALHEADRALAVASVLTKGERESRVRDIRRALRFEEAGIRAYALDTKIYQKRRVREKSQRSRTVLAVVMGMTLARALRAKVVECYENGFGLLNLPVPDLQYGSMSSQVLNPANLGLWDRISRACFGETIELRFTNRFRTKAEMVALLSAEARRAVRRTDSCDSPRRIGGSTILPCGTCGSCRFRQLSLTHEAELARAEVYAWEPTDPQKPDALLALRHHAAMLATALTAPDQWTALVRLQPELRLVPFAEDERLHGANFAQREAHHERLRADTVDLLRRHVVEIETWSNVRAA